MKKKAIYFLIIFCAFVLQTSVLPLISPAYATGDILLMLVLSCAILDGFFSFFWWAIFTGIIFDLVSYTVVGVHALIFLMVVYFVSFFSRRFSVELKGVGVVLFGVFVVAATLISKIVAAVLTDFDPQTLIMNLHEIVNLKIVSIQILYNIFLFLLCFFILRKTKKFFAIN